MLSILLLPGLITKMRSLRQKLIIDRLLSLHAMDDTAVVILDKCHMIHVYVAAPNQAHTGGNILRTLCLAEEGKLAAALQAVESL